MRDQAYCNQCQKCLPAVRSRAKLGIRTSCVPQSPPAAKRVSDRSKRDRRYEVDEGSGEGVADIPKICATSELMHAAVSSSSIEWL
jgi:hypothetical protein